MVSLVAANPGELRGPRQPRRDTEHDNVCNLLGAVFLHPASAIWSVATCASAALL